MITGICGVQTLVPDSCRGGLLGYGAERKDFVFSKLILPEFDGAKI